MSNPYTNRLQTLLEMNFSQVLVQMSIHFHRLKWGGENFIKATENCALLIDKLTTLLAPLLHHI